MCACARRFYSKTSERRRIAMDAAANYLLWLREGVVVAGSGRKTQEEEKRRIVVHRFWQPWLQKDDAAKQNSTKQLPTTKWKRDRRTRPEYLRKSDPKFPEVEGDVPENGQQQNGSSSTTNGYFKTSSSSPDAPLDMSVKQRGLPPSYSQAISDPSFRSSYRPSVIANCVAAARDELPSGISMCDPIIDEHFRRSLGKDYNAVFSNNNVPKEIATVSPPKQPSPPKIATNVIELMDSTGLSVDEHFAKALGDTWLKLNKKDAATELKNNTTETHGVVTH